MFVKSSFGSVVEFSEEDCFDWFSVVFSFLDFVFGMMYDDLFVGWVFCVGIVVYGDVCCVLICFGVDVVYLLEVFIFCSVFVVEVLGVGE